MMLDPDAAQPKAPLYLDVLYVGGTRHSNAVTHHYGEATPTPWDQLDRIVNVLETGEAYWMRPLVLTVPIGEHAGLWTLPLYVHADIQPGTPHFQALTGDAVMQWASRTLGVHQPLPTANGGRPSGLIIPGQ